MKNMKVKLDEYGERVWVPESEAPEPAVNPHQMAAKGFGQSFGLHPVVAVATVAVDMMLQSATIISGGLLIPFSIAAAVALAVITYRAQKKFYGDDGEAAGIKAAIVGLLTAIPSPLPYALFIPAGVVGWWHRRRERKHAR
jgi:hypothetical protein